MKVICAIHEVAEKTNWSNLELRLPILMRDKHQEEYLFIKKRVEAAKKEGLHK